MIFEESLYIGYDQYLRIVLLTLEVMIAFLCFQFSVLFFIRYSSRKWQNLEYLRIYQQEKKKQDVKKKTEEKIGSNEKDEADNQVEDLSPQLKYYKDLLGYGAVVKDREVAWGCMFSMLLFMRIMIILADFYSGDIPTRSAFLLAGFLEMVIAFTLMAYSFEQRELKSNNFLITKIYLGIFALIIIFLFVNLSNVSYFISFTSLLFALIMQIQYARIIILRSKGLGSVLIPNFLLMAGLLCFTGGFVLSSDYIQQLWGNYNTRLIGNLLQVIGVILCGFSFYLIPHFDDMDWIDKIRNIYIVHPSGIALFQHEFRKSSISETDLTTSALIAIKSLIQELGGKKKESLSSIQRGYTSISIESGKNIFSVIMADADSLSVRAKNRSFCQKFEEKYGKHVQNWNGDISIFSGAKELIGEIFRY